MRTHMRVQAETLARGPASEDWARIDPIVYVTEARRQHARALAAALGGAWRGFGRGLSGLTALLRRHVAQPLARGSERRRAIAQLTALDARLLADIGLRRSDIELAVDGLLSDPRVTRRTPAPVVTEEPLERPHRAMPAATTNANRPAAPAQPDRIADLAA